MKRLKKVLAVLTAFLLVIGTMNLAGIRAYADSYVLNFNGSISGTVITYTVGDKAVKVNIDTNNSNWSGIDEHLNISTDTQGFFDGLNGFITSIENYDPESMEIMVMENLDGSGFKASLVYSNNKLSRSDNGGFPNSNMFFVIRAKSTNNNGQNPPQNYNSEATLTALGTAYGTGGLGTTPDEFCLWVFGINGGNTAGFSKETDKQSREKKTSLNYDSKLFFDDKGANTVTVNVTCRNWRFLPLSIEINGTPYSVPVDTNNIGKCFEDQAVKFDIPNVPKADSYTIKYSSRQLTENEYYMGNFGWWTVDGPNVASDDLVEEYKGSLEFVSAVIGNNTYNTVDQIANDQNNLTKWEYKDSHGEAVFPVGTILTVRLIPKSGFQLTSFELNGFPFEPGKEAGVYTFTVKGGNFHLQAKFEMEENTVETPAAGITGGTVYVDEADMSMGTAVLNVSDASLTESLKSSMMASAGLDENYTIAEFVDIKLNNVVNKFKDGKKVDPWTKSIEKLTKTAGVTLDLDEPLNENVVVLHQKDDGTFETLVAYYDIDKMSVSFGTQGFSNYAIAYKGVPEAPSDRVNIEDYDVVVNTNDKNVTVKNDARTVPKDAYNVVFYKWEGFEGGESIDRIGESFPTTPGSYIAVAFAKEDSSFRGSARSNVFYVSEAEVKFATDSTKTDITAVRADEEALSAAAISLAASVNQGETIEKVTLEVAPKEKGDLDAVSTVSGNTKAKVTSQFVYPEKVKVDVIEIVINMLINSNSGSQTRLASDTGTVLEIGVDYDLSGKEDTVVVREHAGDTAPLAEVYNRNKPYIDGSFYLDRQNNRIYIYSSKFSQYVIAYSTQPGNAQNRVTINNNTGYSGYTPSADTSSSGNAATGSVYVPKNMPVYRLFNTVTGEHFFTRSEEEKDYLTGLAVGGWTFEGIAWYSAEKSDTPVYRLFDAGRSGLHKYISGKEEIDSYIADGWINEGIAWYSSGKEGKKVYILTHPDSGLGIYHYTASEEERDVLLAQGWSCSESDFSVQ